MSPLPRLVPIGSRYRPFRPRLDSVLSRLRPAGAGPTPRSGNLSPFSREAKPRDASVHLPLPLVEVRLPVVRNPVPGLSHPVPLISDLITPVSNEVTLVSGPRTFLAADTVDIDRPFIPLPLKIRPPGPVLLPLPLQQPSVACF